MILRRLALFIGLVFAFAATQVPAYVQQYRQALGGAIGELAAVVAQFDSDSAQVGLSESGGVERLKRNADQLARERGDAMADTIKRLQLLRDAQDRFRTDGPLARLGTFVSHYDPRVAREAFANFQAAVPATPEAFVLGVIGFIFGGGMVHVAGRPLRRRVRETRTTRVA